MAGDLVTNALNPKDHTLLIVDDESDLREVLAFGFQREGFNIIEAENGRQAYAIVESSKIDLVISDIQMPGGSGVELLDNIRNNHHELPVLLFLTGYAELTVEEAYNKGAEALFAKPFDFKAVLQAVRYALERKDERWRQRAWRGETALPVEIRTSGSETTRTGRVNNLARGGVFITADGPLPKVNDRIEFKIKSVESSVFIEARGTVKWVRPSVHGETLAGYGVEFTDLSDVARTQVIELINFLKTRQHIPKA